MKKRIVATLLTLMLLASLATGCGKNTAKAVKLDPDNPVSLKIWHYYNGTQQATFEDLLEEFNATVGHEDGIYVEAYSYGSVSDLDKGRSRSREFTGYIFFLCRYGLCGATGRKAC